MRIFDTMARKKVNLQFREDRMIKVFVCGLTVQDNFHVGHARTFIFFDAFVKYLRTTGHRVFYIQNVTDIDDKIITRAKEENVSYDVISKRYTKEFFRMMDALGVNAVNLYAFATDHIAEIIQQIEKLISKGIAYETSDGIYFSVSKFSDYGKLWGQDPATLLTGAGSEVREEKMDPRDFAIWKKMKPGEPYWDSPWGKGRPGWHVEDTAITDAYFGPTYDIHGGGTDLIFPHHDAEIAIERSISGKDRLADHWIHTAMLNINDEKMSKSLKNFVTIKDVLGKYPAEVLRYALLNTNFSAVVNYGESLLQESQSIVNQLSILYNKIRIKLGKDISYDPHNESIDRLNSIVQDNMDLRGMFREVLDLVSSWNSRFDGMNNADLQKAYSILTWVNSFTGVIRGASQEGDIGKMMELILRIRGELREKKEFKIADSIRKELREMGIYIEDRGQETIWWISPEGAD